MVNPLGDEREEILISFQFHLNEKLVVNLQIEIISHFVEVIG